MCARSKAMRGIQIQIQWEILNFYPLQFALMLWKSGAAITNSSADGNGNSNDEDTHTSKLALLP